MCFTRDHRGTLICNMYVETKITAGASRYFVWVAERMLDASGRNFEGFKGNEGAFGEYKW